MHFNRGFQYLGNLSLIAVAIGIVTYYSHVITYVAREVNVTQIASTIVSTFADKALEKPFSETFSEDFTVEEASSLKKSKNTNWWVSSGAYLISEGGVGKTVQEGLSFQDVWFKRYRSSNPRDTDSGYRPQNIFRLVLKKEYLNFNQEVYVRATVRNLSDSKYRNESNGILLFNRYQDQYNLYYAGIRVDGQAVIKKKLDGVYTTLGATSVFSGGERYNNETNSNLLPLDTWMGVRSTVENLADGSVKLELFLDKSRSGNWERVLSVIDDNISNGGAIKQAGHGGIRTDFMDVEFDDYVIEEIQQ